ncbi:MAG: TolB family protein, partial [Thermodesulfobacteriota bacterium]
GSGDDLAPKISANSQKLVYLQQQAIGQVWITGLEGSSAHPISLPARRRWTPSLSPDGNQVAFAMGTGTSSGQHIYVVNRDGGSPRQISFGKELVGAPRWSPDGKWIAYTSRQTTEPPDSNKVYLLEAANPGKPKLIAKGSPSRWLDSERLMAFTLTDSWIVYTDGRNLKRFFQDSTFAIPILKEKYIFYQDLRPDRAGGWIVPAENSKLPAGQIPKKIISPGYPGALGPDGSFYLYVKNDGELWKINLPEGKEERLPGTYPGLALRSSLSVSYEGKEVVYIDGRTTGKLVMIENLFK